MRPPLKPARGIAASLLAVALGLLLGPALPAGPAEPRRAEAEDPEPSERLARLQERIDRVILDVTPATVRIQLPDAVGSGVIVSPDGLVLSAAHVTGEPGRRATVHLTDGRKLAGVTLGGGLFHDGGMLQIEGDLDLPHVELPEPRELELGAWCLSLGYPRGGVEGRPPVPRLGRVGDDVGRFLLTDCALISGDSGGPLFDLEGRLIGIHSRIEEDVALNYHVPMSAFRLGYQRMLDGERWFETTAMLGVQGLTGGESGAVLGPVLEGRGAALAGLLEGDRIRSLNGEPVDGPLRLRGYLGDLRPGDQVRLEVVRDAAPFEVEVELSDNRRDAPRRDG